MNDWKMIRFSVPSGWSEYGELEYMEVMCSGTMLPYLAEGVQRLAGAVRRRIEVPARMHYEPGTFRPSAEDLERCTPYVYGAAMADAMERKLSVVSISPIRFEPHPHVDMSAGVGRAVVEYIGAEMVEWKEDRRG